MLQSRLPSTCTIHTSKALKSYTSTPSGSYILNFADETTAEADVLIGADGIRSVVRRVLYNDLLDSGTLSPQLAVDVREHVEPQWSGVMVYRTLIQAEKLREIYPTHSVLSAPVPLCVRL